ncbi:MAG: hypothetical protein AAFV53_06770 [Myxococcota bacterium]
MTRLIEPLLIFLTVVATFVLTADTLWTQELRWVFSYSAAVILGQGLIRDLITLLRSRDMTAAPVTDLRGLCAESTVGLSLLIVGAGGLTLLGVHQTVALGQVQITILLAVLLTAGWIMKDYVVALRRVEDHRQVRVR